MTLTRRFALLQFLLLWQGGFLFYALVVVPVGADVLGSDKEQGFITQRVTVWLNRLGWPCLALFAWDALATADPNRRRTRTKWLLFVFNVGLLGLLAGPLHDRLDDLLDLQEHRIRDRGVFYRRHAAYLWVSTAQWGLMLLATGLALAGWRATDARNTTHG